MLIKNGTIVTSERVFKADILIKDGVIDKIGMNLEKDDYIDAEGMFVFPGAIDVHTHFGLETKAGKTADDFYTGTVAAASGGTTTIIDHLAFGPKDANLMHQVNKYHEYATDSVIDYSFHGVIQRVDEDILNELAVLKSNGISSVKFYTTYDYPLKTREIKKLLKRTKELGMVATFHAEKDNLVRTYRRLLKRRRKLTPYYHAKSRPAEVEIKALEDIVTVQRSVKAPLYMVHTTTKKAMKLAKRHKIYVETCPQYLLLDEDYLNREDGVKYIFSPPLRKHKESLALWEGINKGLVDVIATDHCAFNYTQKKPFENNFLDCPNGIPGVELRPLLMFSEGVAKKRITPEKYVQLISTNPAKIFGLYPKKGDILLGSDADFMILDPRKKSKITVDELHSVSDYTPYEGVEVFGEIYATIQRGNLLFYKGEPIARRGQGEFLKR